MVRRRSLSDRKTIHVYSDGTPETTHVIGPDGVEIPNVASIRIDGESHKNGLVRVSLEIVFPHLDVDATVEEVELRCPLCGHGASHRCGTT